MMGRWRGGKCYGRPVHTSLRHSSSWTRVFDTYLPLTGSLASFLTINTGWAEQTEKNNEKYVEKYLSHSAILRNLIKVSISLRDGWMFRYFRKLDDLFSPCGVKVRSLSLIIHFFFKISCQDLDILTNQGCWIKPGTKLKYQLCLGYIRKMISWKFR